MLHDTEYYDFLATAKRLIRAPEPEKKGNDLDGVSFQPPAVGGGHTDVSAQGFLKQFRGAVPENHELGMPARGCQRRVVFLKFWRNIAESPIRNHHLAMLDKTSIRDSDIHEAEINFKGFAIQQNRLNPDVDADKLRWVYFPDMQRDEIICFQQGDLTMYGAMGDAPPKIAFPDSRPDHATFHGAFEDPGAPSDAAPRQSIEAGAFVFLPEEASLPSKL